MNERTPERLTFIDMRFSRIGKSCITHADKYFDGNWDFDWLKLSPQSFKLEFKEQLQNGLSEKL